MPWVRRRGFPVTVEVETIVTMARELPIDQFERIMDNALARGSIAVRFETVDACVDLDIPAWRLIVEADGRRWHTRKPTWSLIVAATTTQRHMNLVVLRFTWKTLTMEPTGCLETLIRTGKVRSVS